MKSSHVLVWLLFIGAKVALAQSVDKELGAGYYVVVGAYDDTRELYASRFAESLTKNGCEAHYGFNTSRNLFFVYINYFTSLKSSLKSMQATRKSGKFVDAWVRVVSGDIKKLAEAPEKIAVLNQAIASDSIKNVAVPKKDQVPPENKTELTVTDTSRVLAVVDTTKSRSSYDNVTENPEIKQYSHMTLGNTDVFLSLFNAANDRIVDGDVQVIDPERTRLMMKVNGNEYLTLPDPKNTSGKLSLICDVFGYRKIQNEISYSTPLADTIKNYVELVGTTLVVNFNLVRYHKGDIATLYNVYFYNDAALMQPDSRYELNSLLQLLKDNSSYRIKLHGHTNGNHHGKILTVGPENNFFSLSGAKESTGSSIGLSQARAEVIKDYLMAQGVDGSRIETKAWGGKKPLYDKHSVNARKNVRVEVEMLDD